MIPDHPHALLAKVVWEAVSAGDADALGGGLLRGSRLARLGAREARGKLPRPGGGLRLPGVDRGGRVDRLDLTLEDILVGGEYVSVLFRVSGLRKGRRLETGFVLLFRIEGSRLAEVWSVPRDQYTVDEFWA